MPNPAVERRKAELRAEVRAKLKGLTTTERETDSALARRRLESCEIWRQAGSILFFAPLPEELDIWPLLALALGEGKSAALPRFVATTDKYEAALIDDPSRDLSSGRFGIREPADHCIKISLNRLDLILVPGVAFDLRRRRLGRGKGFYDQLLAETRGMKCGVAFDCQIVSEIPTDPHDISVNCILTPTRWIEL
jgi:5-formyltetrahydrofolate cyclo-ligase